MAGQELTFIDSLRALATYEGARGLRDDAALVRFGATSVITHDMLIEGVHFLRSDPPESVAWKLVAVNASDLAAKGALPCFAILGYTLAGDSSWDAGFVSGLGAALSAYGIELIGGDTVSGKERSLGMTMIGDAGEFTPTRSGAHEGDALFVTGVIGDAGAGLKLALQADAKDSPLLRAYRLPQPQIDAGRALAPVVSAMMDISDGLLIDCARLAQASGLAAMIDLDAVPLSPAFVEINGTDRAARLFAATSGDDYQLLFTSARPLPPLTCPVARIGQLVRGSGVHLHDTDGGVPLPATLGWVHD